QKVELIDKATPRFGADRGCPGRLDATLLQGQEAPREIPTVDGGHVLWEQWPQILRVVPVEEVPPIMREPGDALECLAQAHRKLARAEVAEVVGRKRREKHHPDVRRRRPVSRLLA